MNETQPTTNQMIHEMDEPMNMNRMQSAALSSIPDHDELTDCDEMPSLALTNSYSFASVSSTNLTPSDPTVHRQHQPYHRSNSNSQTVLNAASKFTSIRSAVPFRSSNSSLLDMTRDESHDEDDGDFDVFPSPTRSPHHNNHKIHPPNTTTTTPTTTTTTSSSTRPNEETKAPSVSLYEQTENSLMSISESLTGSFCVLSSSKPDPPSCLTDCTIPNLSSSTGGRSLFSDGLVQRRLEEDIHYLLGSSILPCCEEKSLFQSCFFSDKTTTSSSFEQHEPFETIRNRAGESWRARAYRVKRLREERMIEDGGVNSYPTQRITQSYSMDALEQGHGHGHHHTDHLYGKSSKSPDLRTTLGKPKQEINSDPLGRMIGDCIEPITRSTEEDEFEMVWKQRQDLFDDQDLCYDSDPGEASFRCVSDTGAYTIRKEEEKESTTIRQGYNVKRCNSVTVGGISVVKGVGAKRSSPSTRRRRRMHFDTLCDVTDDDDDDDDCHVDDHHSTDQISLSEGLHRNHIGYGRQSGHHSFDDSEDEFLDTYEDTEEMKREEHFHADRGPHSVGGFNNSDIISKVQSSLNETWTLTWHPAVSTLDSYARARKSNKQKSLLNLPTQSSVPDARVQTPRCIQLWFERGNRIRKNDIVEPKLMWRDAFHPHLVSQRKLNESSTSRPYQLCLLTICRILEATANIDRKKYPFAKISCSFLVRTCDDDEYLFEAINEDERDNLVFLWKLVVARLASQAVVGDGDGMVGEFFVPASFGVPG